MDVLAGGALEEHLRLLRAVVEQSAESVLITTAQLDLPGPQIVYVNGAFTRMTGYTPEEALGKTLRILQGPKTDSTMFSGLRKDCATGKVVHGEVINYRKDGSELDLEWSIGPSANERGEITHFVATLRDITDRRRLDEQLRDSEGEFRSLFDLSAVGVARVSAEGRYIRVNRKFCEILGYSEQELLGLTLHEVTHPDDRQASAIKFTASLTGGPGEYSIEKRYVRKDGGIIWVFINWTIIRDAAGKLHHSVANVQDITERKYAELALEESKQRLQLALEAADVGTWRVDLKTGLETRDAALSRMIDLPSEPLTIPVEKRFERVYPGDAPRVRESWERGLRTGLYDEEYRLAHPGGKTIWVRDRGRFFNDPHGDPLYATGALADTTARKQAEDALREKASLLDLTHDTVMVRDSNDVITFWNHGAEEMYGWTEEEALGQVSHVLLQTTFPNPLEEIRAQVFQQGRWEGELVHTTRDGMPIAVASRWTIQRDEEGRFVATLEIDNDISTRKRAEEALRRSEALNQAVLNSLAANIAVLDRDGRIIAVNEAWNRFARANGGEAIADSVGDNYLNACGCGLDSGGAPESNAEGRMAMNGIQAVLAGALDNFVLEYPCHSPSDKRWFLMSATPLTGGRGGVVVAHTNITERKQFQEALRESQERLELALEAGEIGTFDWNVRTNAIVWTEQLKATFGQPSGATHGVYKDWSKRVRPDDLLICEANIQETFRKRRHHSEAEYRIIGADTGAERWIHSQSRIFYDAQGEPLRMIGVNIDITERKRAEEALKKSAEEIRDLYDHAPCGYHSIDKDGVFVRMNDTELQWLGYARGEVVGKMNFADLLTAQGLQTFEKNFPRFKTLGVVQDLEFDLIRNNGTILPVLLSATALKDHSGNFLMSRSIVYDITDRKQAEAAIRHSEARFRELADAMPQIVFTCRADGMSDYINRQGIEFSGESLDQPVQDAWIDTLHPDDRARTLQWWEESVQAGQPCEIEYRLRRKDGQYRWRLSRVIPVRNAQVEIVKWIGTSTDIHDRKEAEAEREELLVREQVARAEAEHAAESIRRLQAVTDSALSRAPAETLLREMLDRVRELVETDSAAILLLGEDGQSLVVRAAIGLEEEAIGLHIPIGQGIAGSIAANRAPLIVADISTSPVINMLLRLKARSLIGAPLIVEGRLIGVIHADTTQPRTFTENDVRLLQLAADRVALAIEQTRLYEVEKQARRQAEESNRMKDEFLALVSHELRSPLTAMLGYAHLLRFGPLDAQKVRHAVDVIERSGRAQTQLIDDLLDTARIISGKLRLDVGPVDMVGVIEAAVQTIYPAADAKGITIQTDVDPTISHQITGDPERLQQVAWNLLSNAVKFTPSGGRVEVRLERQDPHISITVSDTGKGISPDFLPYVFDRFRQADASSSRRYGGLGLGLALVQYLVELHGGTIAAMSAGEGRGASFKVLLPVRAVSAPLGEAEGASRPSAVAENDGRLAGVRVLVVDDEDDARELVQMVLAQYGAEVVAAGSAAEAFALITTSPEGQRPDVMVTDLGMPGEDGYSLLRRLREWEHERGLYTPTVALTAYGRSEDRVRALMAGFQMHVAKPVEPAELAVVIASIVHRTDLSGAA